MKTKKELREAYKQMKFRMGVFQIRNTVNGKIYLDHSTNLDAIWNRHKMQLDFGRHPNTGLQADWLQYGEENFRYEILGEIEHEDDPAKDYGKDLKALEQLFRDELQPFGERGYHGK
ncbi:MAG: GIY-YIG nuclease family protein [Lewinellaceae bacterium]|nr:GIY-YIG nuclease family protein [Lewinellaceae bacterium]